MVEDNEAERQTIIDLLGHDDIQITGVRTGAEALAALLDRSFDCAVLDLRLPDMICTAAALSPLGPRRTRWSSSWTSKCRKSPKNHPMPQPFECGGRKSLLQFAVAFWFVHINRQPDGWALFP